MVFALRKSLGSLLVAAQPDLDTIASFGPLPRTPLILVLRQALNYEYFHYFTFKLLNSFQFGPKGFVLNFVVVAEKASLNDFFMVMLSGDMMKIPTPDPFWLATPSIYNYQDKGDGACTIMIFLLKSHFCLGLSNNLF